MESLLWSLERSERDDEVFRICGYEPGGLKVTDENVLLAVIPRIAG